MAASSPADRPAGGAHPRGVRGWLGRAGRWLRGLGRGLGRTSAPSGAPRVGVETSRLPLRPSRRMISELLRRRRVAVLGRPVALLSGETRDRRTGPAVPASARPLSGRSPRSTGRSRGSMIPLDRPAVTRVSGATGSTATGAGPAARTGSGSSPSSQRPGAILDKAVGGPIAPADVRRPLSEAAPPGPRRSTGDLGSVANPAYAGTNGRRRLVARIDRSRTGRAGSTPAAGRSAAATGRAPRSRGSGAVPDPSPTTRAATGSSARRQAAAVSAVPVIGPPRGTELTTSLDHDHHAGGAQAAEPAWRASVQARPLETAGSLPTRWLPVVRSITGRSHARFTTGPATRQALAAAGALGATTGTTLHLRRTPTETDLPVVAHELAHSRVSLARPRFLLAHAHGSADADERAAHAVAGRVTGRGADGDLRPTTTAPGPTAPTAPDVRRLPVSGLAGAPAALSGMISRATQPTAPSDAGSGGGAETVRDAIRGTGGDAESGGSAGTGGSGTSGGSAGTTVIGGTTGAAAAAPGLDLDQLVESLETRLIRELERRGGRFADVF